MADILLLGAGFNANWGVLVTAGLFNALVADPEDRGDGQMLDLLWRNRVGEFDPSTGARLSSDG